MIDYEAFKKDAVDAIMEAPNIPEGNRHMTALSVVMLVEALEDLRKIREALEKLANPVKLTHKVVLNEGIDLSKDID